MHNALTVLRNLATDSGFELSFKSIGSLHAETQAHLVIIRNINTSRSAEAWLLKAFQDVAVVCILTPDFTAAMLAKMRQCIYQNFDLTPKEFSDTVKGAWLLAQTRVSKTPSVYKLFLLSNASCHAVFKSFIHRVFKFPPAELLEKPDAALSALEARLPILATALVNHFTDMLQKNTEMKNEQSLFLVFLREKTNTQNQHTKPTHKTNTQNQHTNFLTERKADDRFAPVNAMIHHLLQTVSPNAKAKIICAYCAPVSVWNPDCRRSVVSAKF